MLHFVLGRIKSGKTTYIIDKIKECRETGTLFLVPEQQSHSMERLLCRVCGNTVSAYSEVTSFRRLAARVKSENGGVCAVAVGGGRRILMLHSAVRAVCGELSVLSKSASRPDRLPELLDAIDELKAYGVSPRTLSSAAKDIEGMSGKKLSELALIYAAYENELSEDEFDAYDELGFIAESLHRNDFWCDKTLYLDGFSGFTAAEFDILDSATAKARDVYIALELPREYDEGMENGIFDKTYNTKKRILEICKKNGVKYDEVYLESEKTGSLAFLDRALFSEDGGCFAESADNIHIARAPGAFEECEKAAAYILDCVRAGARFNDFSVAVCGGEEQLSVCESVFSRYGIPVYISDDTPLTSKSPVALIVAALDCVLRGFRRDAVMEYVKTGFSGISARALSAFENYMYTWSPKASEWSSGCDFVRNPLGISAENTPESEALLKTVNRARKKIYAPIIRLAGAIAKGKTGKACAEALYDFINEINLPRRISAYAYIAETEGRLAAAQEYDALTEVICGVIDSIGQSVGDERLDAEELYYLFRLVVSEESLSTIPASLDMVSVSDISRAEGTRCGFRIILGANDGAFPKGAERAGVISDSDRISLSDFGIELAPGMCERIFEEYRTIHSTLCSAEKGLYISSSAVGANGEAREESPVVSKIRSVYGKTEEEMSLSDARLRAKIPCFDQSIASGRYLSVWEEDEEYSGKLHNVRQTRSLSRGPINSRENIEAIFGRKIKLSASRADLFSSCRYAYFLKYGLGAEVRGRAEISPIEAGSLMHYVLEYVISHLAKEGDFDVSRALALAEEACSKYTARSLSAGGKLSARMEFLVSRITQSVKRAVEDICRELAKGQFMPSGFEVKFSGAEGELPPIEIKGEESTVLLRGAVDRVDTYELDGRLYFRVIDYKSGKKEFSLDETVNGIGMQMLLYMFALEEMGKEHFGKMPQAAGVMYVPIAREANRARGEGIKPSRREGVILRDMRIIDAMEGGENKEYIPAMVDKKGALKRGSVVLTGNQFEAVKAHMKQILAGIGDELSHGEIEPNPYVHKGRSSCDFCEYKAVCAFDEERGGDVKRELCSVKLADIINDGEGTEDE